MMCVFKLPQRLPRLHTWRVLAGSASAALLEQEGYREDARRRSKNILLNDSSSLGLSLRELLHSVELERSKDASQQTWRTVCLDLSG